MKIYIETENHDFIVEARNSDEAIAKLWRHELRALRGLGRRQLDWVRWSDLAILPEYRIHYGARESGFSVHARGAILYLSRRECRLAVLCFLDQFNLEYVRNFPRI